MTGRHEIRTSGWRARVAGILGICAAGLLASAPASAALGEPEKWELKFGFIKLTDMVPLAVAYERGYFEDEGLYVTLEAQANWKVLFDRVVSGELEGIDWAQAKADLVADDFDNGRSAAALRRSFRK